MERLKHMKETLMCCVEGQMSHLDTVDTKELGEAIDMLKDLEEAIYYATITKAMHATDNGTERYNDYPYEYPPMMYYGGDGRSKNGEYMDRNGNGMRRDSYKPHQDEWREGDWESRRETDPKEGRSGRSRRQYMDSKIKHHDSAAQMRELEKYMSELSDDIVEMLDKASLEERQYLAKKMTTLATKIEAVD